MYSIGDKDGEWRRKCQDVSADERLRYRDIQHISALEFLTPSLSYGVSVIFAAELAQMPRRCCRASCSNRSSISAYALAFSPVGKFGKTPFVRANPWLTNASIRRLPPTSTKA